MLKLTCSERNQRLFRIVLNSLASIPIEYLFIRHKLSLIYSMYSHSLFRTKKIDSFKFSFRQS